MQTQISTPSSGPAGGTVVLQHGDTAKADARFSPDVPGVGEQQTGRCEPHLVLPPGHRPRRRNRQRGDHTADVRLRARLAELRAVQRGLTRGPSAQADARAFHQPLVRPETELCVERVRVARVQDPAGAGVRPVLDDLAHELDAEPAAAALLEHIDVGEVDEARRVAVDRAGEPDLAPVLVDADDVCSRRSARPAARASAPWPSTPHRRDMRAPRPDRAAHGRRPARIRRRGPASRAQCPQAEAAVVLVRRRDHLQRVATRALAEPDGCGLGERAAEQLLDAAHSFRAEAERLRVPRAARRRRRRRRAASSRRAARRRRRTRRSSSGAAGSRRARAA